MIALRDSCEFIGLKLAAPTFVFSDNMAAVQLADNNTSSKRLKHVATRIAFLREVRDQGAIALYHISGVGQIADIFTKPLPAATFHEHRRFLVGPA